jgi:hypothetical protein
LATVLPPNGTGKGNTIGPNPLRWKDQAYAIKDIAGAISLLPGRKRLR